MQYRVILGGQAEREKGLTPVITVSTSTYLTTTFNEMVDWFLQEYVNIEESLLLSRDNFVTLRNLIGERIIFIAMTSGGVRSRQYFYIFQGKYNVAVFVHCLIQIQAGDTFDEIFDNMVKTLEWIQMY